MQESETKQVNPWLKLWVAPRETFQKILDSNPYRVIIWLALLSGILSAVLWMGSLWASYPDRVDFRSGLFITAIIIGGMIYGILQLYFGSWLYQLTGSWLGGRGSYTEVKCAVGWGMYPGIVVGIISIILIYVMQHPIVSGIISLANLALGIWALIIFLKILGQAHKFSAWRALAAVLLALLLVFVAIMLVSLLVPLLSPLFVA